MQRYDPVDMDHIEKEKRPTGIMIWKCHHSFCDGISAASLMLALSDEFDRSYFLASKDVPWYYRLFTRVMTIFLIPKLGLEFAFQKRDSNYFTKKRSSGRLSGIMNCSTNECDVDLG